MADVPAYLQPNAEPAAPPPSEAALPMANAPGSGIPLLDHENQHVVHVPYNDLEGLLKTGRYSLPKTYELPVVSPDGEHGTIGAEEAVKALHTGFRSQTSEEVEQNRLQKQYGDSEGLAALAGAARSATFGLSDQVLTKTGLVKPETLSGLDKANPISSGVGQAVGILAPAVLSGGESLLGEAASAAHTGVEAASATGKVAERFVAGQLEKLGVKNAAAKAIIERMVPAAAGSAVEGAFYGAGQLVSEQALGDADFNAEALASHLGAGALLGGAFGAAFSGASELAGPVGDVLSAASSPFTKSLSHETDAAVSSARLLGVTPAQLTRLEARNPGIRERLQGFLRDDLKLGLGDTAETLANKNEALREAAGSRIGSVLGEIDEALVNRPDLAVDKTKFWTDLHEKITKDFLEPLENSKVPGAGEELSKVKSYLSDIRDLVSEGGTGNASDLQTLKKNVDDIMKWNKTPGQWTIKDELAYASRDSLKQEIDGLANRLQEQGLSGDLSAQLKLANQQYANTATFSDFLSARVDKAGDRHFSLMGTLKNAGLDVARKLVVMGKIETAKQAMQKLISNTTESMFLPAKMAAASVKPLALTSILQADIAKDYQGEKPKKPATVDQAYKNMAANLNGFTSNPAPFAEKINRQTSVVYNAAPNTSGSLDRIATNGLMFLAAKLPKTGKDAGMFSSILPPRIPSTLEQAKFERYVNAVNKPESIMHDLQRGTITREQTETLREVYPNLYKGLQSSIMDQVTEKGAAMPYSRRIQLGMLFNIPTDAALIPANLMALQATFGAQQQKEEQGAVNPTVGGLKELGGAERTALPTETLATDGVGGE